MALHAQGERPQAGRQRQFNQIGMEWLGVQCSSDVESISLAWDLLSALGLRGLQLQINSLGTPCDRKRYRSQLVSWLQERADQLDPDSKDRLATNPLRILDSKTKSTQVLLQNAPTLLDALSEESSNRFADVQLFLRKLQIPFVVNTRLVRGLDYYGHTAFEITSDKLGAQSTVCGGGRYDGLVEQLGGPVTPAFGWALGMERLLLLLDAAAKADPGGVASRLTSHRTPTVYFVNRGELAASAALGLARTLREAGLSVELDGSGAAFGKQFKRADRSGAPWALVIGDQEADEGFVRLKSLRVKAEDQTFSFDALPALLQALVQSLEELPLT